MNTPPVTPPASQPAPEPLAPTEADIRLLAELAHCASPAHARWLSDNARLLAAAPGMINALRAIVRLLDGSQPKDPITALMVARYAVGVVGHPWWHDHKPQPEAPACMPWGNRGAQ